MITQVPYDPEMIGAIMTPSPQLSKTELGNDHIQSIQTIINRHDAMQHVGKIIQSLVHSNAYIQCISAINDPVAHDDLQCHLFNRFFDALQHQTIITFAEHIEQLGHASQCDFDCDYYQVLHTRLIHFIESEHLISLVHLQHQLNHDMSTHAQELSDHVQYLLTAQLDHHRF